MVLSRVLRRHAARRPEGGPVRARRRRRGLGRAARRSRQVLPGRLSVAGSDAVAAVQRSRAGEPALPRAGVVSPHDLLRRPRSRLHRRRRPDPEQRFGHDGAAGDGGHDATAAHARRLPRVQRRPDRREALRRPRRAVPRGRVLQLPGDLPALEVVDGRGDCVQLADPDGDRQAAAVVPLPAGAGKAGHGDGRELRSDAGLRRAADLQRDELVRPRRGELPSLPTWCTLRRPPQRRPPRRGTARAT